jgi:hypothetical protein
MLGGQMQGGGHLAELLLHADRSAIIAKAVEMEDGERNTGASNTREQLRFQAQSDGTRWSLAEAPKL